MALLVLTAGAGAGDVPADDLAAVREMVVGYQVSQIVYVACELRLIDHLADGMTDPVHLAAYTGTQLQRLVLLLDCLAGLGLLAVQADGSYQPTARGRLLDSRRADGLRPTIMATGQHRYGPWGELLDTLRTGTPAFTRRHGQQLHDFYAANPAAAEPFNAAMAALTAQNAAVLAAAYPFGSHRLVVDVGGNLGVLMTAILTAHPRLRGVVFDLPHVAAQAAQRLAEGGWPRGAGQSAATRATRSRPEPTATCSRWCSATSATSTPPRCYAPYGTPSLPTAAWSSSTNCAAHPTRTTPHRYAPR